MVKLFWKNSNLCDHNPPTLQTDGQTDECAVPLVHALFSISQSKVDWQVLIAPALCWETAFLSTTCERTSIGSCSQATLTCSGAFLAAAVWGGQICIERTASGRVSLLQAS